MEGSISLLQSATRMGAKYFLVEESSQTDLSSRLCNLCDKNLTIPYYRDLYDSYGSHKACLELPVRMKHEAHPEHTIVIYKYEIPSSQPCDICRRRIEGGIEYECRTCPFRTHLDCLSQKLPFHPHELELIHSLPQNQSGRWINCEICQQDLEEQNYIYYCDKCSFFVHTYNCRPVVDSSHNHPLMLVEEATSIYSASDKCYGCGLTISAPYYFCIDKSCTSIFLHKHCGKPTQNLEHHLTPSESILECSKRMGVTFDLVEESFGTELSSLFCTICVESITLPYYSGGIYLHKACGDLPTRMEHQVHPEHTIVFDVERAPTLFCDICRRVEGGVLYECMTCKFAVHPQCFAQNVSPAAHTPNPRMENSETLLDATKRWGARIFLVEKSSQTDFSSRFCDICKENTTVPFYEDDRNGKDMHKACGDLPLRMVHESHPGHTIVFDEGPTSDRHCSICRRGRDGMLYECTERGCKFAIHAECFTKKLPFHLHQVKLIHSLPENRSGKSINCGICQEDLKGQTHVYHCEKCRYFVHSYNCRPVDHSSHEHPMMLVEEATRTYSASEKCYGCGLKISPPYYFCIHKSCRSIFLHKLCAELAPTLKHRLHPAHTLTLFNGVKSDKPDGMCNACHLPLEGFSYSCEHTSCRFTLDTACAMKNLHQKHEFHEHSLLPSHSKTSYPCCACNLDSEGPSYQCTTCRFWVHQQCASLTKSRAIDWHPHKLELIYSIPEDSNRIRCHVCRKDIHRHSWAYHCAGCRFFTHIHNCSDPYRVIDGFDYEKALAAAIHLPVAEESASLAELVFMKAKSSMMLISYPKETCRKCVQLLAPPCNNCPACRYFLSRSMKQGLEPILNAEDYVKPGDTGSPCYGFGMHDSVNGSNLLISSSVLPRYVKHEGHHHVLSTTYITQEEIWCYACDDIFVGYGFRCNICEFTIDPYCALLPGSMEHYDDKGHPFKLTCFSVEGVEEYICEICEGDITTRWFYHCEECDYSIHPRCVWNYNFRFGPFIQHDSTEHYVTLVPTAMTVGFDCLVCHENEISGHECSYSLFCEGCKEMVHMDCMPPNIQIEKFSGEPLQQTEQMRYKSFGTSLFQKRPTCLNVFKLTPTAGVRYSYADGKYTSTTTEWDAPELHASYS